METLIITRSNWLRGEGSGNSYLLRKLDSKMCCLGFYAIQHGCTMEEIKEIRSPDKLVQVKDVKFPKLLGEFGYHTDMALDLMPTDTIDRETKYYRYGMKGQVNFKEPPPRVHRWPAFCFASDYETGEPITLHIVCEMTWCQECIPEWWMAL